MKAKRDKLFLNDILECCQKIEKFLEGKTKEDFLATEILQDALARNVEIIGEAAKNLSEEICQANPQLPWRDIMRMRDKIVHHYFRVNLNVIWQTVTEDVPHLKIEVQKILTNYDDSETENEKR